MTKLLAYIFALTCVSVSATETLTEYANRNGGWIQIKGKGFIAVIDCRNETFDTSFKEGVDKVFALFQCPVHTVKGERFSIQTAKTQLHNSGANVAIFIVDDPSLPVSLTAQEERWTLINAAKVKIDNPPKEKFSRRMSMLFMRQCTRILGSDASKTPDTCHYHVFSLNDLDAIKYFDLGVGANLCINEGIGKLGIEPIEFATYRDACEMNIAPPPTNISQKAIWNDVMNKRQEKSDPTARWKRDFEKK